MDRYDTGFGRPYDDGLRYRREGRFYDFRRDRGGFYANPYDAAYGGRQRSLHRYAEDLRGARWEPRFREVYDHEYRFAPRYPDSYRGARQTNYGDPFDDRQRGTPMRVRRGAGWDQHRNRPPASYDRDYPKRGFRGPYRRPDQPAGFLLG